MSKFSRRNFLKNSLVTAAGLSVASALPKAAFSKPESANDTIRMAVIGFNNQGAAHISRFSAIRNVSVTAICDVDKDVIAKQLKWFEEKKLKVETYTDVRKLLENKDIDAVAIATPNHWHALMTIWACQAGKDVFVEKPVSHNIWEGRKMVEAARKYNRIVQAGTHKRSDLALKEAFEYIQQGNLGKIKVARGICYKKRPSIGKVDGPQPIPSSVDYDLWTGPAPLEPLMRQQLHYDWHWFWNTGNGDFGNQGVHELDLCRWALGQKGLPKKVISIGGRFGYDDDGQTPNTQITYYDYEPAPLIFEVRGLPSRKSTKNGTPMDWYKKMTQIGVVIECENGCFAGDDGGGWVYDPKGNKIKQFTSEGGASHNHNFIAAVRSRNVSDLNADILEGHISSALCHMGNISYRIGHKSSPEQIKETLKDKSILTESFKRFEEHLWANWVDINEKIAVLGPWLEIDKDKETFVSSSKYDAGFWANQLVKDAYREPFVIPENGQTFHSARKCLMKFALCNEMFGSRSMEEVCSTAAKLGYHGIEIAPFTLAKTVNEITPEKRKQVRQTAADNGLEVVGLHWLLAGTSGLHMTSPDEETYKRTKDYFDSLLDLCSDFGGKVLVIGSPKQRSLTAGQTVTDAWARAVRLFEAVLGKAEKLGLTLCIEPLSTEETDFINTVSEGLKMVKQINHPNFRLNLDVKAMCSEGRPVPDIIRSVKAEDIGHFHVNDANLYGPGMGNVDYKPIAEAINNIGWDKWLSVEVFKFDPDPETIAKKSIEYLRSFWS